jgi:Flp pilus assembly pilin Flp
MIRIYSWLNSWSDTLGALWRSKRIVMIVGSGQGLVEYALVLALVAVLVISVVLFAGGRITLNLSAIGVDLGGPSLTAGPTMKPTPTPKATKTPKPTKAPKATPKPKKSP